MPSNDHLVLLIEDEQPIRRFLRASLSAEGYRVAEATTGEEGIKLAASQPPDFVILAEDPHLVDPDHIKEIGIVRTVVGGKTMFSREA